LLAFVSIVFFASPSTDHWRLGQAIILCVIMLVFKKLSAILFSNKCVEDFIPRQRNVSVLIDKTPTRRTEPDPEDALATNWRSR
jgi:hypothetical protein